MSTPRGDGDPHDAALRLSEGETLDLLQAAVYLGVSPTTLDQLLRGGVLRPLPSEDARLRRLLRRDLDRHREERFALRQREAARARERRGGATPGDLVSR